MRLGILSTRINGKEGGSLEVRKWSTILRQLGHELYYCAGELDKDLKGRLVPRMHFQHEDILAVQADIFRESCDEVKVRETVEHLRDYLYAEVKTFIKEFFIELLIVENALSIPMNVPLGMALTDLIRDLNLPAIAHHHDFGWERKRFATSWMQAEIKEVFPPVLDTIHHVVINSLAQGELLRRRSVHSEVIPNIFDFTNFQYGLTAGNIGFRKALKLSDEDWLILQPTRVIPRKGIEHAVDLVCQLRSNDNHSKLQNRDVKLGISHPSGDEGDTYFADLQKQARECDVPLIYAADSMAASEHEADIMGRFQLWDAYLNADFVTYPSLIEGFGNAFLEAIFFRLPLLIRRYDVFISDIEPLGFDLVKFDQDITDKTIDEVISVMIDPTRRRRMVEWNFALAKTHFSYQAVTDKFKDLIEACRL